MNGKEILEKAYVKPTSIPWYEPQLPNELLDLIETGKLKPCKLLDIGCGLGNHSMDLAKKGFEVTGIDISDKAISYAKELAKKERVKVNFISLNVLEISKLKGKFDFILEWGVLHFISFEDRKKYVDSVVKLLNKKGKYLSLSFDESSPEWGGGRVRTGITGSRVYYSLMSELEKLFKPYFRILEAKKRKTLFKNSGNEHIHNYLLMEKL